MQRESIADPQVHAALVKRSQVTTIVSKKRLIIAVRMFVDSPPAQRLPLRLPRLRAFNRKDRKAREEDLSQVHNQQLGFGHFLDRVAQALATQTGVFDSTIWHVIDAE